MFLFSPPFEHKHAHTKTQTRTAKSPSSIGSTHVIQSPTPTPTPTEHNTTHPPSQQYVCSAQCLTGHLGQWLRAESATAAAPEAHDPPAAAGRDADPIAVALLRGRRALHLDSDMENSSGPAAESAAIVSTQPPPPRCGTTNKHTYTH